MTSRKCDLASRNRDLTSRKCDLASRKCGFASRKSDPSDKKTIFFPIFAEKVGDSELKKFKKSFFFWLFAKKVGDSELKKQHLEHFCAQKSSKNPCKVAGIIKIYEYRNKKKQEKQNF